MELLWWVVPAVKGTVLGPYKSEKRAVTRMSQNIRRGRRQYTDAHIVNAESSDDAKQQALAGATAAVTE